MKDHGTYSLLAELPGRFIQKIRRVMYVLKGKVTTEAGPIEITLADGIVLLLDVASDGEALSVKPSPWTDHFAEPLSPENREFIERSGKWTAFDVSQDMPYSKAIGQMVEDIITIKTPDNKVTGATFMMSTCVVQVQIEADEVSVDVA